MAKYEVHGETNKPSTFSWEASGFYSTGTHSPALFGLGRNDDFFCNSPLHTFSYHQVLFLAC